MPVIDDKNGNKVHIIAGEYEKVRNELPMKPAIDPVYIEAQFLHICMKNSLIHSTVIKTQIVQRG